MASFDSFSNEVDEQNNHESTTTTTRPFDDDGYIGYDPLLASQRYESKGLGFKAWKPSPLHSVSKPGNRV